MRDWMRWVSAFSALVFFLSSVSMQALASPQKSVAPTQSSHFSLPATSSTAMHLSTMPKLPSLAPPLPLSVGKNGGLCLTAIRVAQPVQHEPFFGNGSVQPIFLGRHKFMLGVAQQKWCCTWRHSRDCHSRRIIDPIPVCCLRAGYSYRSSRSSLDGKKAGRQVPDLLRLPRQKSAVLLGFYVPSGVTLDSIGFTQATPLVVSGAATVNGSLYSLQQARGTNSAT